MHAVSASTILVSTEQAMVTDQAGTVYMAACAMNEFKIIIYFAVISFSPTNNQGMVIDLTTSKL